MQDRFYVVCDRDRMVWFIRDYAELKPSGGVYFTEEAAQKYCDWLNVWIKE